MTLTHTTADGTSRRRAQPQQLTSSSDTTNTTATTTPPPPPTIISYPMLILPWLVLGTGVIFILWLLIEDHSPLKIFVIIYPFELIFILYWIILQHELPIYEEFQCHGVKVNGTICYESQSGKGLGFVGGGVGIINSPIVTPDSLMKQRIQYQANGLDGTAYLVTKDVGKVYRRKDIIITNNENENQEDQALNNDNENQEEQEQQQTATVIVMAGYPKSGIVQDLLNDTILKLTIQIQRIYQIVISGFTISMLFLSLWAVQAYFEDEVEPGIQPTIEDEKDVINLWKVILWNLVITIVLGTLTRLVVKKQRMYKLNGGTTKTFLSLLKHKLQGKDVQQLQVELIQLSNDENERLRQNNNNNGGGGEFTIDDNLEQPGIV